MSGHARMAALMAVLSLAGCASSGEVGTSTGAGASTGASATAGTSGGQANQQTTTSACRVPPSVLPEPDGGAPGCFWNQPLQICEGGAGGTCHSACEAAEYGMTCIAARMSADVPSPDSSLGCQAIPIPTPISVLYYCCPCGS